MSSIRVQPPGTLPATAYPLPAVTDTTQERRAADRFPIQRELRYRLSNKRDAGTEGTGQTLNISSNGVLFRSSDPSLVTGKRIELSISWPAQLDNRCHLKLVARGRISRVSGQEVAVSIQQYEFRTAGRSSQT
jgi:hypothetical protein